MMALCSSKTGPARHSRQVQLHTNQGDSRPTERARPLCPHLITGMYIISTLSLICIDIL